MGRDIIEMTTISSISTIGRGQCRHVLFFALIMFLLSTILIDTAFAATGSETGNGPGTLVNHPNLRASLRINLRAQLWSQEMELGANVL